MLCISLTGVAGVTEVGRSLQAVGVPKAVSGFLPCSTRPTHPLPAGLDSTPGRYDMSAHEPSPVPRLYAVNIALIFYAAFKE
eukprot:2906969-Rhodomonas_salina.1